MVVLLLRRRPSGTSSIAALVPTDPRFVRQPCALPFHCTATGALLDHETRYRLNVFALPSQTTVLTAMIVLVLLVTTSLSLVSNLSWLGLIPAAGMWILPVRAVLARPEHDGREWSRPDATAMGRLLEAVEKASVSLHMHPSPSVRVTSLTCLSSLPLMVHSADTMSFLSRPLPPGLTKTSPAKAKIACSARRR